MGSNVAELVTQAAARTPNAPAIVCSDRTTTWSELERLVRAFAGGLQARGIGPGERVALLVGNSAEFVVAYFGTLRAGCVSVPINTSYTAFEVGYQVEQSGAALVVCDPQTLAVARDSAGEVPLLVAGSEDWRRHMVGSTPPPADPGGGEDLATLMFTSGTSGKPKGAMLSHRALLANLDQLASLDDPPATVADDVVLIVLPLFHSYALNGALGMVAKAGATAVLTERFDPEAALDLVQVHDVTVVITAPPVYRVWSQTPGVREALAPVRLLVSGAAPLTGEVYHSFADVAGQTVWEGYGMTEASPVITTTLVSGRPMHGSVGRPLPGLDLKLCDEDGELVDEGDPGEIIIRGPNLFSGYWPDGHAGPGDGGWWPTSDVGIIDGDGDLRLVDRRSDLIIVSGFNVYPREVEDALGRMPGISEVAVVGVPDDYTGETIKAMIVASEELDSDQVIAFARTRLARFKCPTIVEFIDSLPHSGTGKISKGALRERIIGVRE